MIRFAAGVFFGVVLGAAASVAGMVMYPLPPAEFPEARIVRMLDLTINAGFQDKNTTSRRQRFECLPVKEKR
jgi:hypothetical protein